MGGRLQCHGQECAETRCWSLTEELSAFPAYSFKTRVLDGKPYILDTVRRTWVRLTPEEWVRQHLLRALADLGYPSGLTAVEKGFDFLGRMWRADVVVFNNRQIPVLLAECKAQRVPITEAAFDQIARYNAVIGSRSLLVTNGNTLLVGKVNGATLEFLDHLPTFEDVSSG